MNYVLKDIVAVFNSMIVKHAHIPTLTVTTDHNGRELTTIFKWQFGSGHYTRQGHVPVEVLGKLTEEIVLDKAPGKIISLCLNVREDKIYEV